MPRGFLVKRNKKATPVSYRVRSEEDEQGAFPSAQQDAASAHRPASPRTDSVQPVQFGNPEIVYRSMYSPTRPVSREHERACLERRFNLGSPISAESFPAAPIGSDHAPFAPVDLKIGTSNSTRTGTTLTTKRPASDTERKGKPASKKAKANRKLQFEDEVTTSPVLGLKIKEGPVEQKPRSQCTGGDKPLGEFVCQLCREAYADPFSLAQHKCSRIVRIEYRCPECDKLFSCPANLASHRRWHKPKTAPQNPESNKTPAPEKEETSSDRDTPSPELSESGSEDGLYDCQHCGRKFKRQAYLKKHVMAHHDACDKSQSQAPLNLSASECHSHLCPVCGENFPSRMSQERHIRLQHSAQIYSCKYCPAMFYSSPGLTRHINKCHPSENRQVILLQMPVRPAC
uniref:Insulinoma-associated 1a n=1 Tax=Cyprinus carpio TaxID=7962 RepID=A0A8C1JLG2_CYPCA